MKHTRFSAALMALIFTLTTIFALPMHAQAEKKSFAATDAEKGRRKVGIHAQNNNVDPQKPTTLYRDEDANIYLAVDKPNKGDIEVDGSNITRLEPHYDMNGYSVKFYYEKEFFDINSTTPKKPLNYKLPFEYDDDTEEDDDGITVPSPGAGYFPYEHNSYETEINGKKYNVVYATILFTGTWLPDRDVDWYNLCSIPVHTRKTGTTEVFVEVGTTDEFSLELYSKNKPGESRKNFELSVVNGGRHTVIIEDQPKPPAPVVTPKSGTYPEKQTITIEAQDNCDIFYTLNGGSEQKYMHPFDITTSTTLVCYAKSTVGQMLESDRVTYTYKISAQRPYLFKSDKLSLVPDIYDTETNPYKVYFSDIADEFTTIPDGTEIYYTFRSDISVTNPVVTQDSPDKGWVAVTKKLPELLVEEPCTVRMFKDKEGVFSEVVTYELGFSPSVVEAVYFEGGAPCGSGRYDEPVEIKLVSPNPEAVIFYTLDGTSPLNEANRYDPSVPIFITGNKTLRAVAKSNGKYGPVMTNWYVIEENPNDFGVIAFYPSGVYEGEAIVTLIAENPGYTIEYKSDGGEWITYDKTSPLRIKDDTVISARAVDSSGNKGEAFEFIYRIMPEPPIFTPESTQFTNSDKVTLYCPESNSKTTDSYELYYTLDGTWPITKPTDGSKPELIDSPSLIHADSVSDSAQIVINGYTVITAVVYKDGKHFSTVVQNSYDVVKQKLIKPLPSLTPGNYEIKLDHPEEFVYETLFLPVSQDSEIYYTVSYNGEEFCPDPVPNTDLNGTKYYNKNNPEPIEIKGNTVIKAVAVNRFGSKSDVAIIEYNVFHQPPMAAPGEMISGTVLPMVPVSAVEGCTVTYKLGDFENVIESAPGEFYIDTATGNAYADPGDPTSILGKNKSDNTYKDSVMLEISSELHGLKSDPNYYTYSVSGDDDDDMLAAPYADKLTGKYDEVDIDGENNLLVVRLFSLNANARIQYKLNKSTEWEEYDPANPVKIKDGDDVLQARCVKDTQSGLAVSKVASYSYVFYPIAPVITKDSGWYSLDSLTQTQIKLDKASNPHKPYDKYEIHYRRNGDPRDYPIKWDNENFFIELDHTMSVKAYVLNTQTGRTSPATVRYYIIESGASVGGAVGMDSPYYGVRRVASHLVSESPWNQGIKLFTDNHSSDVKIYYKYRRTNSDGTIDETNAIVYDPASPISVNSNTRSIDVEAWLVDSSGEIDGSRKKFDTIYFDTCEPPTTTLEKDGKIQFASGTKYEILDNPLYLDNPKMTMYYTTDGSDPVEYDDYGVATIKGNVYKKGDTPLTLKGDTTVKTVYRSACGFCFYCDKGEHDHCQNPIFGTIGTYRYVTKSQGGSSSGGSSTGGGGSISKSRLYTKDIFGNEHPTHIGYINGYPDGSVKPDGNITREEVAAILYRIKNKTYDEPFSITGEVFPDVKADRWSVREIEYMAADDVIVGYPDTEFKPSRNLTRAEFAALINRFIGGGKYNGKESKFSDLTPSHWAYSDIEVLAGKNLINGYEDGTYRPENSITRAEVMTVINKLLGRNPSESYVKSLQFNPFNDLLIDKWYYVIVLEATVTHNYHLNNSINKLEVKWEDYK